MLLDDVLPRADFAERHEVAVAAPPERALAAAREVTLAEMPLAGVLFALRGMPGRSGSVYDAMRRTSFAHLAEEPAREFVLGAVGQPWRPRGGMLRDVDFGRFDTPGFAKMAINFVADGSTLSTETRVLLTDDASRRRFRRYWLAIRPFSGLIRRLWLRAAKRRAERGSAAGDADDPRRP